MMYLKAFCCCVISSSSRSGEGHAVWLYIDGMDQAKWAVLHSAIGAGGEIGLTSNKTFNV